MKKVFVVEDDADIREMIEYLLSDLEYDVLTFANAKSFTDRLSSQLPDLILLDIMLPDGNGAEICQKLKTEEPTSSVPVVLMSAHIDPKLQKDSCADDFIPKPFDIEDLAGRIRKQLEKAQV